MIETFADEMLDSLKSDEPIKSLTVCMEKCYNVTTTVTNELQNGISDAVQSNMDRKGFHCKLLRDDFTAEYFVF